MNSQMCIIYGEGNWYVSGENKKGRLKPAFKGAGQTLRVLPTLQIYNKNDSPQHYN